jgi:hypothetical protein
LFATAEDLLATENERRRAEGKGLYNATNLGVSVANVQALAAERGISWATIRRAREEMGLRTSKEGVPAGLYTTITGSAFGWYLYDEQQRAAWAEWYPPLSPDEAERRGGWYWYRPLSPEERAAREEREAKERAASQERWERWKKEEAARKKEWEAKREAALVEDEQRLKEELKEVREELKEMRRKRGE